MSKATLHEIKMKGIDALNKALDPIDMVRFFQQYDSGEGDYTKERKVLLKDFGLNELRSELRKNRKKNASRTSANTA